MKIRECINKYFYLLQYFLLFLLICGLSCQTSAATLLPIGNGQLGWRATLNKANGTIFSYQTLKGQKWINIPFRLDTLAGPSWKGVKLSLKNEKLLLFAGTKDNILYTLQYLVQNKHLVIRAGMKNLLNITQRPSLARLVIGVNSEMKSYPQWNDKFFPTLLRCEKTHFWGYFMTPEKRILAIGVSEPVASYTINYRYQGLLEWLWGHQIYTASLDFLNPLPLPARHPQNLTSLQPGEFKIWNVHLAEVNNLADVKPTLSAWLNAPMIEADRYTIEKGHEDQLTINSQHPISIQLIDPNKRITPLNPNLISKQKYKAVVFSPQLKSPGLYLIKVTDKVSKKVSEASLYVRMPFSWYMEKARDNVYAKPPHFTASAETYYGFYAAFIARQFFPDSTKDNFLEKRFNQSVRLAFDLKKGLPIISRSRIQNTTTCIGILVDLWKATKDTSYLTSAAKLGDFIASPEIQASTGGYYNRKTLYTCVIYPAKSMIELALAEKEVAAKGNIWEDRYQRHSNSANRAIADLLPKRDSLETEGDMTFEDGMITCDALQIGLGGLQKTSPDSREAYIKAAAYLMGKHTCLEQDLIPDARMRGATERYWEALDIHFVPNQAMSSPHGWTAWKIYADYYLYLLTGKEAYLKDFMDTLGSCVQLINLDNGNLNWAFITDPYLKSRIFVQAAPNSIKGKYVDTVIGEQSLPMIGGWFRPKSEDSLAQSDSQGRAGDNTVYEIFKALAECALDKAYVIYKSDGSLATWNCSAKFEKGLLTITPNEKIISSININSVKSIGVLIYFKNGVMKKRINKGMAWIIDKKQKLR